MTRLHPDKYFRGPQPGGGHLFGVDREHAINTRSSLTTEFGVTRPAIYRYLDQ